MPKRINPNLAKIHRSYLVGEASALLGVHSNTVRAWVKEGLPVNDNKRPMLILGCELREFLQQRNRKAKRPCKPNEMYCLKCRRPQKPMEGMVDYEPMNDTRGQLKGLCPSCGGIINRFATLQELSELGRFLDVSMRGRKNT